MSFLKSLFGMGKPDGPAAPAAREDYKGYAIEAQPYAAEGQFQVAGTIAKDVDGARKEHRFVRADRFASKEEAASFCLVKARQIIDQNGDRIFNQL
jgi:hypothetical protein